MSTLTLRPQTRVAPVVSSVVTAPICPAADYPTFGHIEAVSHRLIKPHFFWEAKRFLQLVPGSASWQDAWQLLQKTHPGWLYEIVAIKMDHSSRDIPAGRNLFTCHVISTTIPGNLPCQYRDAVYETMRELWQYDPATQFYYLEPIWETKNKQRTPLSLATLQRDVVSQQRKLQRSRKWGGWLARQLVQRAMYRAQREKARIAHLVLRVRIRYAQEENLSTAQIIDAVMRRERDLKLNFGRVPSLEQYLFDPIIVFASPKYHGTARVKRGQHFGFVVHWD